MAKQKGASDLLGVGLLLIGIFIILISNQQMGLTKYIGIIGGSILSAVESWFLFKLMNK